MSALRQPKFAPQYYSPAPQFSPQSDRHRSDRPSARQLINSPRPQERKIVKPRKFPQQNRLPQNIKLLSLIQKSSFALALVSMAASTGLYISTVKIPQLWSQEYRNLEELQRQERQLIAINETIKYQIAREASQDDRLSISQPDSAVFIPPVKVDPKTSLKTQLQDRELENFKHNNLGY